MKWCDCHPVIYGMISRLLLLETRRDTERATKFIAKEQLTYTLLEDGEDDAAITDKIFGVRSFPTSFLIDRQGRVMYYHLGFEKGDEVELEEQIKTLLEL